jgi:hypothetical protein
MLRVSAHALASTGTRQLSLFAGHPLIAPLAAISGTRIS